MKTHKDQIIIYYNPKINKHKKLVAHAKSMGVVLPFAFDNVPEAYNVWTTIWDSMTKDPVRIFDKDHQNYNMVKDAIPMDFKTWYDLIMHHKDMIVAPIAIRGNKAVLCVRQTEVYQLMEVEPDRQNPSREELRV